MKSSWTSRGGDTMHSTKHPGSIGGIGGGTAPINKPFYISTPSPSRSQNHHVISSPGLSIKALEHTITSPGPSIRSLPHHHHHSASPGHFVTSSPGHLVTSSPGHIITSPLASLCNSNGSINSPGHGVVTSSSIHHTPVKSRDLGEDMEAIRLSRQDNPYLQVRQFNSYLQVRQCNHCLEVIEYEPWIKCKIAI